MTGEDPALIPDDYVAVGGYASMQAFQESQIAAHLARTPDDSYIPFLFPGYGTGVLPSAMGCRILFQRGEEPAVEGPVLEQPADVRHLEPPDPERDGLMPRVLACLACIDHLREHSDLPVSFTDNQGPLNIALNLVGLERLIYWMVDEPMIVPGQARRLALGRRQHRPLPDLYREFVVPYNGRVMRAFGGGTLHYCGNAEHQLENFLATDGLVGVNVWCMGELAQVFRAREVFGDRVTIMICDYTPTEPEPYFRDPFAGLRPRGTIISTYPSSTNALRYGAARVETVVLDVGQVALAAWETITRLSREGLRG